MSVSSLLFKIFCRFTFPGFPFILILFIFSFTETSEGSEISAIGKKRHTDGRQTGETTVKKRFLNDGSVCEGESIVSNMLFTM